MQAHQSDVHLGKAREIHAMAGIASAISEPIVGLPHADKWRTMSGKGGIAARCLSGYFPALAGEIRRMQAEINVETG